MSTWSQIDVPYSQIVVFELRLINMWCWVDEYCKIAWSQLEVPNLQSLWMFKSRVMLSWWIPYECLKSPQCALFENLINVWIWTDQHVMLNWCITYERLKSTWCALIANLMNVWIEMILNSCSIDEWLLSVWSQIEIYEMIYLWMCYTVLMWIWCSLICALLFDAKIS